MKFIGYDVGDSVPSKYDDLMPTKMNSSGPGTHRVCVFAKTPPLQFVAALASFELAVKEKSIFPVLKPNRPFAAEARALGLVASQ